MSTIGLLAIVAGTVWIASGACELRWRRTRVLTWADHADFLRWWATGLVVVCVMLTAWEVAS